MSWFAARLAASVATQRAAMEWRVLAKSGGLPVTRDEKLAAYLSLAGIAESWRAKFYAATGRKAPPK